MSESVVIVGAGEAGGQTAISLRQGGYTGPVTIIGDEPYVPYERPPLSKQYLAGELELERMFMRATDFYGERDITLRLGESVVSVDAGRPAVTLTTGETIPAGSVVFATGGRVRKLTCPGADLDGIHYLRTIDDVRGFRDNFKPGTRIAIVGGGYIGLEVAAVAIKRQCAVTVLEVQDLVLNRVTAPEMSYFYETVHREEGVDLRTGTGVDGFEGDRRVKRVRLGNGSTLDTDLVIVGIGIEPNVELAEAAGLTVDNGIVVDEFTRTSAANVYAVGDCTNHPNPLLGRRLRLESVPNALGQGKAAAAAILGAPAPYAEVPWFWSDQYDLKLQMAGISDPGDEVIVRGRMESRKFSACYLRDGVFVAVNTVNMAKDFLQGKKLIAAKVKPDPAQLADPEVPLKSFL